MRFVHIADMHFDMQFKMLSDKIGIGEQRRYDQRVILRKIINYIKENNIKAKAVYLSLGDREEKTRNPVMATVGHAIRSVHETISDSGINTILEWNQGNHFKDVDIRMAKALTWSIRATVHG